MPPRPRRVVHICVAWGSIAEASSQLLLPHILPRPPTCDAATRLEDVSPLQRRILAIIY